MKGGPASPTIIKSDKDGNLVDQNGNKYQGTFDGKNVTFKDTATGNSSTGEWRQTQQAGEPERQSETTGITGGGTLGDRFHFTFLDHGADQTLNFKWQFDGTRGIAESILERANFKYWMVGGDIGYDEYRRPAEGRDSTHFLVSQRPGLTIPEAKGLGHVGEFYPGFEHLWHDVLHQ